VKEQLKGNSFAEEDKFLLVVSELVSETPPDRVLRSLPTGIEGCGFFF
jgi:hypothetical protein